MLMKCKKMPPETLLLSVVAEQPDIFQDICKSFCQKCYNWYYCGGGGCLFTIHAGKMAPHERVRTKANMDSSKQDERGSWSQIFYLVKKNLCLLYL